MLCITASFSILNRTEKKLTQTHGSYIYDNGVGCFSSLDNRVDAIARNHNRLAPLDLNAPDLWKIEKSFGRRKRKVEGDSSMILADFVKREINSKPPMINDADPVGNSLD